MYRYRLTKHQGLGNDFLVLLDPVGDVPITPELVIRLCDRHRGLGADGLIRATPPPEGGGGLPEGGGTLHAVMDLWNADGRRAEMSGNGVRCLAQALLLEKWAQGEAVVVATDAGVRRLEVVEGPVTEALGGTTHVLSVDMGDVRMLGEAPEWSRLAGPARAAWATAGNPHLVVEVAAVDDLDAFNLLDLGERVNAAVPEGANVHLLALGPGDDEVTIRTYERGVGLTEACGTGACASAVVARAWEDVGGPDPATVTVTMPGGSARVALGAASAEGSGVRLIGPATSVAALEYPWP